MEAMNIVDEYLKHSDLVDNTAKAISQGLRHGLEEGLKHENATGCNKLSTKDIEKVFRKELKLKVLEADVKKAFDAVVKLTPFLHVWRNNTGASGKVRYGLGTGSPDYVGIDTRTGRAVFVELKSPTGKLSKAQEIWHAQARLLGAAVIVINTTDKAEIAKAIVRGME